MNSDDKAHNFLQSQLISSAESLRIDYHSTNRKPILTESYQKWQEFKQKIENLNDNLPNLVVQRVQTLQLQKLNASFNELLDDIVTKASQSYNSIAELNLVLNQNIGSPLPDIEGLNELKLLIKNCLVAFTSNLLSVTKTDFQAKIYLDTHSILNLNPEENPHKTPVIYIAAPDNSNKNDKIPDKKISDSEIENVLSSFAALSRKSYSKKVESIEFHLRTFLEDYFLPCLDDLSNFAGIVLAKIAYFSSNIDTLFEPEFNDRFNSVIDDFFIKKYPNQLISLKDMLKRALDNNSIQEAKSSAIKSFLSEAHSAKESTTFKLTLDEFFFKARTKDITERVPVICLNLIKEATVNKKITIIEADQRNLSANYNFAIKCKSVFLIKNDEPWNDAANKNKVEKILYVRNKELVRSRHYIEAVMSFLPPEFEFSQDEPNQLFFLSKLIECYDKKQGNKNLLDPSQLNAVLNINLPTFLSFTIRFLSEFAQIEPKMIQKAESEKLSRRVEPEKPSKKAESEKVSKNASPTQFIAANSLANEDINMALSDYFQAGNQEPVKSFESQPGNKESSKSQSFFEAQPTPKPEEQSDASWEISDDRIFESLLKQKDCSVFNDLKTFKQVTGIQDFTFFDKECSANLWKNFIAQRNSASGTNQLLEEIQEQLSALKNDAIKGLILLFVPSASTSELLALRIKFSSKNRTHFYRESQNKNQIELKETLKEFSNWIYAHLPVERFGADKSPRFEDDFMPFQFDQSMKKKVFKNHYFPYLQILQHEKSLNGTELVTLLVLKKRFINYLQAAFKCPRGLQFIHSFLEDYSVQVSKLSNVFLFEEQADIETLCCKIKQYLPLFMSKSLKANYPKLKSIVVFGRMINEKNFTSDTIVFHIEYAHIASDGSKGDIIDSAFTPSGSGDDLPDVTIAGDDESNVSRVKKVLDSHIGTKGEYESISCETYEMPRPKSELNFLFSNKEAIELLVTMLLNEGKKIIDVLNVCRLCPSIRYNYLCSAYQNVDQTLNSPVKVKNYGLNFPSTKILPLKTSNAAEELKKTIEMLGFEHVRTVKSLIRSENAPSSHPKIATHMIPNSDLSFTVTIQDIKFPQVPYTLVIINPKCSLLNTNLCNVIEPNGNVYVLKIALEGDKPTAFDANRDPIAKNIEKIQKALPRRDQDNLPKLNFKYHTIVVKNASLVETESLRALLLGVYIQKYTLLNNPMLTVDETSILSLVFSKVGVCLQSKPNLLKLLRDLKSQRFLILEGIMIEHAHMYYHEDGLLARLSMMIGSQACNSMVFSIQNEMEYSFHVIFKTEQARSPTIVVITIYDWSHGSNAANFYTNSFNLLESEISNEQFKCTTNRVVMDPAQQFFPSADRDLLAMTLVDLLKTGQAQKDVNVFQHYLQIWYRSTSLSSCIFSIDQKLQTKFV